MYVKNLLVYPQWEYVKYKIKRHDNRIALLLGTCVYNNLGDHLISYSEKNFLKNNLDSCEIFEIPTPIYFQHRDFLKKYIGKEDLIFITGGGWMGSLWIDDEKRIQTMVKDFQSNTIVILPQTVYYDTNTEYSTILENAQDIYSRCKNLIICTRDANSYNTVTKFFPDTKCMLVPDIALYLNPCEDEKKKRKIGVCIRKDRESRNTDDVLKIIYFKDSDVEQIDTISKYNTIPVYARKFLIKRKIKEFSKFKSIYTDRLHGMIYAKLAGTVCYVFDNRSGKVKGVYEKWLSNDENIIFVENVEMLYMLNEKKYSKEVRYGEHNIFQELEELVKCL